jgi:hypothetical protein
VRAVADGKSWGAVKAAVSNRPAALEPPKVLGLLARFGRGTAKPSLEFRSVAWVSGIDRPTGAAPEPQSLTCATEPAYGGRQRSRLCGKRLARRALAGLEFRSSGKPSTGRCEKSDTSAVVANPPGYFFWATTIRHFG